MDLKRLTPPLLLLALVSLFPPARAHAASVEVVWDAPTTNADGSPLTDLSHYRIYFRTSRGACGGSSFRDASAASPTPRPGAVTYRLTDLLATTYFVSVSAISVSGEESACSNEASGLARDALVVTPPGSVSFDSVAAGASADQTFTVTNNGASSLTVSASVSAPFSILSPGTSFTVRAGGGTAVVVRFRPTTVGSFAQALTFTSSGGAASRSLTGTGTGDAPRMTAIPPDDTNATTSTSSAPEPSAGSSVTNTIAVAPGSIDLATPPSSFTITGGGLAKLGSGLPVVSFTRNGRLLAQVPASARSRTTLTVPFPTNGTTATAGVPSLSAGPVDILVDNQAGGVLRLKGNVGLTVNDTRPCPSCVAGITPNSIDLATPAPASVTITGGGFANFGFGLPVVSFTQNGSLLAQTRAFALFGTTRLTVPYLTDTAGFTPGAPGLSPGPVEVLVYNQTGSGRFAFVGSIALSVSDTATHRTTDLGIEPLGPRLRPEVAPHEAPPALPAGVLSALEATRRPAVRLAARLAAFPTALLVLLLCLQGRPALGRRIRPSAWRPPSSPSTRTR